MKDSIQHILGRFEDAKAKRSPFESDWNSIRDFVRPITVAFNSATGQWYTIRPETMFDGTAREALEELGSALHSFLSDPSSRWFELQIHGRPKNSLDHDELQWLETATNTIYSYFGREDCNLNAALHEAYLDLGSFGTACICQEWDPLIQGLHFCAEPLAHTYFLENSKGRVDTVFRHKTWPLRNVKQEFGEVLPEKLMRINNDDKPIEILHCVYPRTDEVPGMAPARKPFASIWISLTTKEVLRVSGYDSLCYHVPRWTKLSGEFYGRGPGVMCLPDIKMLNAMEKTLIKAGQKQVDPPLVLLNEGFLLPIATSPGALIFKESEESQITPLEVKGNLPWGEDKAEQKREFIRRCFYNDWIRRTKKTREQSATEIMDDRDEMLRLFAPIFGRLVNELHGPLIARSYDLLDQRGKFPPAPMSLRGQRLIIGYSSPAAQAQLGSMATKISQFVQEIVPLVQIDPGAMDAVDIDKVVSELAIARGIPRTVLRPPEEVKAMRQQKQQAMAMQQAMQIAEPASKAMKNIADAQATGAELA